MSSLSGQEQRGEGAAPSSSVRDRVARAEKVAFPLFVGTPSERSRTLMLQHPEHLPTVVESCRAALQLLESPAAREWLDGTTRILGEHLPDVVSYYEGTAAACGVSVESLLAATHQKFLVDAAKVTSIDPVEDEGCSVGAARLADGGAWIAKNRDNSPDVQRRHIVALHRDSSWSGRTAAAQTTVGGPVAASGGVNSAGFCIVSTAVPAVGAPPGVLRSLLLGELLGRCTTVDEALDVIKSVPHLGGTFTLADAKGAVATAELNPEAVAVESPSGRSWVARTNHYCLQPVAAEQPSAESPGNTAVRLETMRETMPEVTAMDGPWSDVEARIAERMTTHGDAGVCRHEGRSTTIATSIFRTDPPSLLTSLGQGCENEWARWDLTDELPA